MNKFNYLIWIGLLPIWTFAQQIVINPSPPPTDGYNPEYLVSEVLIEGDCAQVDNIASTNNSFSGGQTFQSFGYFEANGSDFPFEDGIVLATNNITTIPVGPIGGAGWPGDPDLAALSGQASNNATVIEFDFVPFVNEISFNYLMASNEYTGGFPCTFEDTFAFIMSGPYDAEGNLIIDQYPVGTPGVFQNSNPYNLDGNPNTPDVIVDMGGLNIATLPGTNIPATITNIHNLNNGPNPCGAGSPGEFAAAQFFDTNDPLSNAYNGMTVPLTASTPVIAGQIYKIKLAIGDSRDTAFNSAVFIEGESFTLGDIDLGEPITLEDPEAQCTGLPIVLDTGLPEGTEIVFEWYFGELGTNPTTLIEGEESSSLTVTETGTYAVFAFIPSPNGQPVSCFNTGLTSVEFFDAPEATLEDGLICGDGTFLLDATPDNIDTLLLQDPEGPSYVWTLNGEVVEGATESTLTAEESGVYEVEITFNACTVVVTSELTLVDFGVDLGEDQEFCVEVSETPNFEIVPSLTNIEELNDATYLWSTGETSSTIEVSESGTYSVTVTFEGCEETDEVEVTFIPVPDVSIEDIIICTDGLGSLDATPSNIDAINAIDPEGITYTWSQNGEVLDETGPVLVVSESDFYSVVVEFLGCSSSAEAEVIAENYFIDLGEAPTPCVQIGESPQFTIVPSIEGLDAAQLEGLQYAWSTGESTPTITVSQSGTYSLTTTTANGCEEFDEVVVQFTEAHIVSVSDVFELTCFDEGTLTIPSGYTLENADQIIWQKPDGTTVQNQAELVLDWNVSAGTGVAESQVVGEYVLTVVIGGCEVSEVFNVDFRRQSPAGSMANTGNIIESCVLPQGISPNGDGVNDCFDLSFLAMEPGIAKLQIFNRYGRKVFESTDYTNEFCGQDENGNNLVTGTYFYVLDLIEAGAGFERVERGWVYINREQQ